MEVIGSVHTLAALLFGNEPHYPSNRKLDMLHSGYFGEEKIPCPYQHSNPGPFSCKKLLHPLPYSGSLTSLGTIYY
jgi:hypothetical protein